MHRSERSSFVSFSLASRLSLTNFASDWKGLFALAPKVQSRLAREMKMTSLLSVLLLCAFVALAYGAAPLTCLDPGQPRTGHGKYVVYEPNYTTVASSPSEPFRVLTTVEYVCDRGYTPRPRQPNVEGFSPAITCQLDGNWSGPALDCTAVVCPPPANATSVLIGDSVTVTGNRFGYGETVSFSCPLGKYPTVQNATCLQSGSWSIYDVYCQPVVCPPPDDLTSILIGDNVTVTGNRFGYGETVSFSCPVGKYPTVQNATCLPSGTWSIYDVYCQSIFCSPDISSAPLPPFASLVREKAGIPPQNFGQEMAYNTYGARLRVQCDMGTELHGSGLLTCQANGVWSGQLPICKVPNRPCKLSSCPDKSYSFEKSSQCCAINGTSIGCCNPKTKTLLRDRFSLIPSQFSQCRHGLESDFNRCAGLFVRCFDTLAHWADTGKDAVLTCLAQITPYGCFSKVYVPTQLEDATPEAVCRENFHGNNAVVCRERVHDRFLDTYSLGGHFCLPKMCAKSSSSLFYVAQSTLKLYCDYRNVVHDILDCDTDRIALNCSNGQYAEAVLPSSEKKCVCPHKNGDKTLTRCCQFGNHSFGCCKPRVSVVISKRFEDVKGQCRADMVRQILPCTSDLIRCLSQFDDRKTKQANMTAVSCDESYDCTAPPYDGILACSRQAGALWCSSTCQSSTGPCPPKGFCLPASCSQSGHLTEIAQSDAKFICNSVKLSSGRPICGNVSVTIVCSDPVNGAQRSAFWTHFGNTPEPLIPNDADDSSKSSDSNSGALIGGAVAGSLVAVALLVIAVVVFIVYRRRQRAAKTALPKLEE